MAARREPQQTTLFDLELDGQPREPGEPGEPGEPEIARGRERPASRREPAAAARTMAAPFGRRVLAGLLDLGVQLVVGAGALAGWALNVQGNLSLVAVALSLAMLLVGQGRLLPGIWLLLLGHSFFVLGSLAFPPFRACGLIYQLGGVVALWPSLDPLLVFAAATAAGNLWMAWSVWRR